jgi:uncharacterized protein YbjT (DUF2867 family)
MNILIFGATGMIGRGVLRECLLDPTVKRVVTIGRNVAGESHDRLEEIRHTDLWNYDALEGRLSGFDACFFCLGASGAMSNEKDYTRIAHDGTLAAATVLARLNPDMTFIYVSGAGTSATSKVMWARVKGRTENDLLHLPFKAIMFRPAVIQPLHGARSRTALYRAFYTLTGPLLTPLRRLFPDAILTTEIMGRAMLTAARFGTKRRILESRDIYRLVVT